VLFIFSLFFAKYDRQSQCLPNQKNRSTKEKLALSNLKRSGFVFIFAEPLAYLFRTKRSAAVFLMSGGLVKGTLGIDKHFWLLLMHQK